MKCRLILPVMVALLASETLAGNLPEHRGLSVELDPG
jgi:hypothetical protein